MSIVFEKPSIEEIYSSIQKELKDIPIESMDIHRPSNIVMKPIYNQAEQSIQIPFSLEYRVVFQYFFIENIVSTNQAILNALENGLNGLTLDFGNKDFLSEDIIALFDQIRLDYIHIEYLNTTEKTNANILSHLNSSEKMNWSNTALSSDIYCLSDENFIENAADFILKNKTRANIHIELSGDYFWDIAKLRAFKSILFNYAKLEGRQSEYILVGESSTKNKSIENIESNLLKLTTEAMSAMIGGCEGVWIRPHDGKLDHEFSQRIARNIFHLLNEESYLFLVKDVSSGSYFVENYTKEIAEKIYEKL